MVDEFKKRLFEISNILSILEDKTPTDDVYEYILNGLLIKVYSSFEQFNKSILRSIKDEIEVNHKFVPITAKHLQITEKYVAPTKSEDIMLLFPLLKKSYFYKELKHDMDSVINSRHTYAHNGIHQEKIENINRSLFGFQYIIRFLSLYYNSTLDINSTKIEQFLDKENELLTSLIYLQKELTTFTKSRRSSLSETLDQQVNVLKQNLKSYSDLSIFMKEIEPICQLRITNVYFTDQYSNPYLILTEIKNILNEFYIVMFGSDVTIQNINIPMVKQMINILWEK